MEDSKKLDQILSAVTTPTAIQVAEHRVEIEDLQERVRDLEGGVTRDHEWRRGPRMIVLCSALTGVTGAVVGAVVAALLAK